MRAVLNAMIVLAVVNVLVLFFVYNTGGTYDGKFEAQSLSRLISSYSEPDSNPQFLVRDENQCRFWGQGYCARAAAKRKSVLVAQAFSPAIPVSLQSSVQYHSYIKTREALTMSTTEYVAFLNSNPGNMVYIEQSKQFEEEAGQLVGQLVSYLYDMQAQTIQKQSTYAGQIVMGQYLSLLALLLMACLIRFRKGSTLNG